MADEHRLGGVNRRSFLSTVGLAGGAAFLGTMAPWRPARADAHDRRFVFAYFAGGWDTLLCLDPRDPNTFTQDRVGETRIDLAWDRLPATYAPEVIQPTGSNIAFGPAIHGLERHADKMCVVRGVSMDTVTHEVGRRYFLTGMMPRGLNATGSSVGSRLVAQQGDLAAIPHLVSRVESYNDGLPSWATGLSVASVFDLVVALQDLPTAPAGAVRQRLDAWRASRNVCDPTGLDNAGLLTLVADTQAKARALVQGGFHSRFTFDKADDPEMVEINRRYDIGRDLTSAGAQAAMALQAIKYDIAQAVTIEVTNGLDTHDDSWADDHADVLGVGFRALAQLVDDLASEPHPEGGTLLDRTTILAFSEFGRTATLNTREGRDHSLANACLLMGAGVPHNRVVGATTDVGMGPRLVDPGTGEAVSSGGEIVTPTRIIASVLQSAGYGTEDLRTEGLPCLMA